MGGRLEVRVALGATRQAALVDRDLRLVTDRVERWAGRLTRFAPSSELSHLNALPDQARTPVGPTLGAVLDWAERAAVQLPGLVDITLLRERLAAETGRVDPALATHGDPADGPIPEGSMPPTASWHLRRGRRGGTVFRQGTVRFDLDGVAKGWIADRALASLGAYPSVLVDADGDMAVRVGPGTRWRIGIAAPHGDAPDLGCIEVDGDSHQEVLGIATSGVTVHRWTGRDGPVRHHLIDPGTRSPAVTDVLQATVIARSARFAEVAAKAAVIAGSDRALAFLECTEVHGVILALDTGEVVATPRTVEWLA